jgi:hypothetical protein
MARLSAARSPGIAARRNRSLLCKDSRMGWGQVSNGPRALHVGAAVLRSGS